MFSAKTITQIHHSLQQIFSHSTVLLGGSYLYNEATEDSDVDFYVICNLADYFSFRQYKKLVQPIKEKYPNISMMLVPKILQKYLYYIYGQDIREQIVELPTNKNVIVKNCLKLAYYNYCSYLALKDEKYLSKAVKQIKALTAILKTNTLNGPIFSWKHISLSLGRETEIEGNGVPNQIPDLTPRPSPRGEGETTNDSKVLLQTIKHHHAQSNQYLKFSLINYLFYNLRFILKSNFEFIFSNPDKKIINGMLAELENGKNPSEIYEKYKKTVMLGIFL